MIDDGTPTTETPELQTGEEWLLTFFTELLKLSQKGEGQSDWVIPVTAAHMQSEFMETVTRTLSMFDRLTMLKIISGTLQLFLKIVTYLEMQEQQSGSSG